IYQNANDMSLPKYAGRQVLLASALRQKPTLKRASSIKSIEALKIWPSMQPYFAKPLSKSTWPARSALCVE
ncbi:MAG: hypothetical protein ACPF9G_10920, partial [Paracoccaceae bacterium]